MQPLDNRRALPAPLPRRAALRQVGVTPVLADEQLREGDYPTSEAALVLAMFGLIGGSIGLFAATLAMRPGFLSELSAYNRVPDPWRNTLFFALVGGAFLATLPSAIYLKRKGQPGLRTLRQFADLSLPLGLLFLLPSLFIEQPWHDKPLTYLVELGVFGVLMERALRLSLAAMPREFARPRITLSARAQRWLPFSVVMLGSILYAIYFSYYTILNHQRLGTSGFDLGINVNWSYNALHGHFWRSTVLYGQDGGHFLGNHAIFGMALWLPFYAIKPGADVLLIFQSTMAGLAATTLYLFASTQIPRWSAVVVAYAYLFFAPLHGPNFYDFHELIPPLFFHFLLFWAVAQNKRWLVCVLVPLLWLFREDVAVGIIVLGVFLLVTGLRPKMGFAMAAVSTVWFVSLKFFVMPMYSQSWFANIYKDLQAPGSHGYGTVVQTILINPAYFLTTLLTEEKVVYFLHMFAPLLFLPARRPILFLLAIPGFAFSLLTTGYAPTIAISFQYTCHTIPYLFAASVLMLRVLGQGELGNIRRQAALGAIALTMLSHSYVFGAILQHNTFVGGFSHIHFTMTDAEKQRYQTLKHMADSIPRAASVAATESEVPHVAARMNVYTLKDIAPSEADYILLRGDAARSGATARAVQQLFGSDVYGIVEQKDDLYLFKRGLESPKTDAAIRSLGIRHFNAAKAREARAKPN